MKQAISAAVAAVGLTILTVVGIFWIVQKIVPPNHYIISAAESAPLGPVAWKIDTATGEVWFCKVAGAINCVRVPEVR